MTPVEALKMIASMHQSYDDPSLDGSSYSIGVVDGHRCAANVAREALAAHYDDHVQALAQARAEVWREAAKEVLFKAFAKDAAIAFELKAKECEQQARGEGG